MHGSTELTQQACPRCKSQLSVPAIFREGEWWHQKCYKESHRVLVNAPRLSNALSTIYLRIPAYQELL